MVGSGRKPHFSEEELHPYVAGELDPARRAAIDRHLESCSPCTDRLKRVRSLHDGLLRRLQPMQPDELSWHRLRERVRNQLEDEARAHSHTADVALRTRWMAVGVAAVVLVALAVTLLPKKATTPPKQHVAQVDPKPEAPAQSPIQEMVAAKGWELKADPDVVVEHRPGDVFALWLSEGDLRLTAKIEEPRPIRVLTPKFSVDGETGDFMVSYRANRYRVESHRGALTARGGPFGEQTRLPSESVRAGPFSAPKKSTKVKTPPTPAVEVPPAPKSKASEEIDTVVEAVAVDKAPGGDAWRKAQVAYYRDRDLETAVLWGRRTMAEASLPRKLEAAQLVCDALISASRAQEAVAACQDVLELSTGDARRAAHHRLATLYRVQLGDCVRALPHYNKLLTFGQVGQLQDELRVVRAGCALEANRLDIAERDVAILQGRRAWLARPEAFDALKKSLEQKRHTLSGKKPGSAEQTEPGNTSNSR